MKKMKAKEQVLHITDFQELFELSEDVRKGRSGPLRYTKSLVTLSPFASDAETRLFERMRLLKSRQERHFLRSILQDLTNWSAAKSFGLRGFLVTAESRPATPDYLAAQLNIAIEEVEKALPILEQLGFLERISMDGQAETKKSKRKSTRKKRKTSRSKATKKSSKKSKHKNSQKTQNAAKHAAEHHTKELPDSADSIRLDPARSEEPLKKGKANGKSAAQKEKVEVEESAAQTNEKRRQRNIRLCEEMKQGQDPSTTTTTANRGLSPATAPSKTSTKSDGGQVCKQDSVSSRIPALPSVKKVGDILKLNAFRYDADAWQFADDLLVRARYFTILDVERARHGEDGYTSRCQNERAHWAKAWHKVKGQFDPDSLAWLRTGIFKRAEALGANRQGKRNPESYLMASWNNLVRDRRRKIGGKRGVG